MLADILNNRIQVTDQAGSWESAIRIAAEPMLRDGCILPEYIDAMIRNVKENGDYIIILPGFAMPHARPECGAVRNAISLLKLKKPVVFASGEEISLMIALAASDANAHLDLIAELTDILTDDEKMDALFACNDAEKILEILK